MTTESLPLHLLENTPPCIRRSVFDGHWVTWHLPCATGDTHWITGGRILQVYESEDHPGYWTPSSDIASGGFRHITTSPEEAERLYDEACERLRELGD